MVIEKVLKVNSSDPKVEELRRKLAAMQQANLPPQTAAPAPPPASMQQPQQFVQSAPAAPPVQKPQDDIAKLAQLSLEEQKRLLERQNPELRVREERTMSLVTSQVRELINLSTEANKRLKELETKQADLQKQLDLFKDKHEETLQKMNSIDSRLEKFMGLYELITNQYNPFTENTLSRSREPAPALPALPAKPVGQAGVFSVQDTISQAKANVEVRPEDAASASQSFARVEQLLADLHKQTHTTPAPSKPLSVPPAAHGDLHALFEGFEERLKKQFDKSLQEQLHHRFVALETHLEEELKDALRAEITQLQQDDLAVQQSLVELQELVQSKENSNRAAAEEELGAVARQVNRVRDEVKAIPPALYFRVADGTVLRDIHELAAHVRSMTPQTFAAHVSGSRNDFAEWVEHALGLAQHAQAIRQAVSLDQLRAMFAAAR